MGATESNPEVQGWRILEVLPNGPCWDKGLCVYFDFIVGINGIRLTTSSEEFWDTIRSKKDIEIVLTVFNYKTRVKRDIVMTPNNKWGGDGLLGLVVVRDDFTKCDQQCVRVLKVSAGSPAARAGLQPESDYILGTPISAFTEFSIFRDTVADYLDQALPIYVYNSKEASVRLVEITPSSQWPGEGVLGCITGDGYLHQIPSLLGKDAITFIAKRCYVISSRSPRQVTEDSQDTESTDITKGPIQQQNQALSSNEMETAQAEQPVQEALSPVTLNEKFENVNITPDVPTQDVMNENDEKEDLPSMVRWTDSSNKFTHFVVEKKTKEEDDDVKDVHIGRIGGQEIDPLQYAPDNGKELLDKLETETQQALAQSPLTQE